MESYWCLDEWFCCRSHIVRVAVQDSNDAVVVSEDITSVTHSNYVAIHSSLSATRRSFHSDLEANDDVTRKALFLGGDAPFVYIGQEKITTAGHTGYGIVGHTYIDSERITLGERYGSSTNLVRPSA